MQREVAVGARQEAVALSGGQAVTYRHIGPPVGQGDELSVLLCVPVGVAGVDEKVMAVLRRERCGVRLHRAQRVLPGEPVVVVDAADEDEAVRQAECSPVLPGGLPSHRDGDGMDRPAEHRGGAPAPPRCGGPHLMDHASRVGHRRRRRLQVPHPQPDGVAIVEQAGTGVEDEVGHVVRVHHEQVHLEREVRGSTM